MALSEAAVERRKQTTRDWYWRPENRQRVIERSRAAGRDEAKKVQKNKRVKKRFEDPEFRECMRANKMSLRYEEAMLAYCGWLNAQTLADWELATVHEIPVLTNGRVTAWRCVEHATNLFGEVA